MTLDEIVETMPWYKKIKILRVANDLTQSEVANKCNTTQKIYWLWEKGKAYPNMNSRIAIAGAFDVNQSEIFEEH